MLGENTKEIQLDDNAVLMTRSEVDAKNKIKITKKGLLWSR